MKLVQAGIDLIKSFESCKLEAYPDPGTGGDPWTVGYGCTGPDITEGIVWTQEQADVRFEARLGEFSAEVDNLIQVEITDNQFSACVSLAYNIGIGNFEHSTLLKLLNVGRGTASAALEFPKWDRAAGKEMGGLLRRRLAEQKLFNS
jgi:lysozyme